MIEIIKKYYTSGIERTRLNNEFKLEGIRTKEIISRYATQPALKILDIGGGAGYYSFWLQSLGHNVTLIDLTEDNIEFAISYGIEHQVPLHECIAGNATDLPYEDNQFDLILLMGPLYHLTNREERIHALTEARRVVRPGGIILAAIISRYASLIDGFHRQLVKDHEFIKMLKQDLSTGLHENKTGNPDYFTTSYFHTPQEIEEEIRAAELHLEKLIAVEGMAWALSDFLTHNNESTWKEIMDIIRNLESNRDLLAASPHIIGVAVKNS